MTAIKYTIVCSGDSDGDIAVAFAEASRLIRDGYQSGHNRNDTGAFRFDSTTDVRKGDLPA